MSAFEHHVLSRRERDYEAKMVPVFPGSFGESRAIGILPPRCKQPRFLPVTGHALTPQIGEVCGEWRRPHGMTDGACLYDGAAGPRRDDWPGCWRADRGQTGSDCPRQPVPSARCHRQLFRNEGPGLLGAGRANAARPDATLALIGMVLFRNVEKRTQIQGLRHLAHIAQNGRNVQYAPKNPKKTTNRPPRNVRPFILPS